MDTIISTQTNSKKPSYKKNFQTVDGNTAVCHSAYAMSEAAIIYPITPSSTLGDVADEWSAHNKKNVINNTEVLVTEMQSEAGAAGSVHGSLAIGTLTTTFTASQGLLLMIPNMYKIAGELLPGVFHVPARSIASQALSIFGDQSDIYATRSTGFCMLCSNTVQEAADIALIAHIAAVKAQLPFLHFYDGFRISHEVDKVDLISYEYIKNIIDSDKDYNTKLQLFRDRSLHPDHPTLRGTSQSGEIYFQYNEASNPYFIKAPEITQQVFDIFSNVTGRSYHLFEYFGCKDAEYIVVCMGSACSIFSGLISYLINQKDKTLPSLKIGLISVRLFRPWSSDNFVKVLPKTTKRIAVLDKSKEFGSYGEALFLDIIASIHEHDLPISVIGGRYGLSSKDVSPEQAMAVFMNLQNTKPKKRFTVGIEDDVTHTSIEVPHSIPSILPKGTKRVKFWGMGSDGTVTSSREAAKIIGYNTDLHVQAYFQYDAKKAGGVTISHLRFGSEEINAPYFVSQADYTACNYPFYVRQYEITSSSIPNSIFVLNSNFDLEKMNKIFSNKLKRDIARKHLQFYNIDALAVCASVGLGKKINMVMQTVFFKLAGVIPFEKAVELLKNTVRDVFAKKGEKIVTANITAIEAASEKIVRIQYPDSWADLPDDPPLVIPNDPTGFLNKVMLPFNHLKGDIVKVSDISAGGFLPMGTTQYEKRTIASKIPIWIKDKCTQCNYCSYVCPHACIRPFLQDPSIEYKGQPSTWETLKAIGPGTDGLSYRIQVAPEDCTGCELCYSACGDDALVMIPILEKVEEEKPNWEFARSLPGFEERFVDIPVTVKSSQFFQPLLEFSGACEGCGETPYVKLITQLFGERMVIANATGCTSIWGGSFPANPYTVNDKSKKGPAWGNSLFEDNAEYGYGMQLGLLFRRKVFRQNIKDILSDKNSKLSEELRSKLSEWTENSFNPKVCNRLNKELPPLLAEAGKNDKRLLDLYNSRDCIPKISLWIMGGDGWAYDIGYGGLDHVLASGEDVNVLVMDTEIYSNTGGHQSKATQLSAIAKFASRGKRRRKKELGLMAMQYKDVYVTQISMGASYYHTLQCITNAESYPGPSLILAYSPCTEHGVDEPTFKSITRDKALVDSGYWPLYHFDPRLTAQGLNPFVLDSKKLRCDISDFLIHERRFANLNRQYPDEAKKLQDDLRKNCQERHKHMKQLASSLESRTSDTSSDENTMTILYGSETGNAAEMADALASEAKRRDFKPIVSSLDDYEYEELLAQQKLVIVLCSTCGQGEFPANSKAFTKWIVGEKHKDLLSKVKYAVFALGDHNYTFFNKAGKILDEKFSKHGAQRLVETGLADDQDPDGRFTKWDEWLPSLWTVLNAKEPPFETTPPQDNYKVEGTKKSSPAKIMPDKTISLKVSAKKRLTPSDYDRTITHYEFDITGMNIKYSLGDTLAIYPENNPKLVEEFLSYYHLNGDEVLSISPVSGFKPNSRIPSCCTIHQLFVEVLDIFGRPSRRFYSTLSRFASGEEQKQLQYIATKGEDEYRALVAESVTFYDILKQFPSAHPSIAALLELIPPIRPRFYSIASSQRMFENSIHLAVVLVDWKAKSGKIRYGTCTSYLDRLSVSSKVRCAISQSAFHLPSSNDIPIVMAGLGTGMAPFRAVIQDYAMRKRAGSKIGPIVLFFGCRHRAKDLLYVDELDEYVKEGVLTNLFAACSRDQNYKIYVQHLILENTDLIFNLLGEKNGFFYLCGQAGRVPQEIKKAVEGSFMKSGKMTESEADNYIEKMVKEGRYNIEAY